MRNLLLLLMLTIGVQLNAQTNLDYYQLRSHNSSLLLSIEQENNSSTYTFTAYGNQMSSSQSTLSRYLYQSQEYVEELNLYLFPRRIYSAQNLRFYQPDPKLQYFSPYLFVGADPVNYVDRDGQMGKPLFLYQKIEDPDDAALQGIQDLAGEVSEAYHYPMSDFINGKVGELPEFNGNVFIHGHMGDTPGSEMNIEESKNISDFKVKDQFSSITHKPKGVKANSYDGEEFGRKLRNFSEMNKTPVKNVTMGGCQGSYASESVSRGFLGKSAAESTGTRPIQFAGLQEGKFSHIAGWRNTFKKYDYPLERPKYYVSEEGDKISEIANQYPDGKKRFLNLQSEDEYGGTCLLPYAEADELHDLVNGRIPSDLEEEFDLIRTVY